MHASQIHQLCLLSGRINCQGRLYHISQHVIGLTVLLDLHLSHHFWQCLPFVWNFFDVVPVLSLQNFVPLWKQKKIIQRVWKSPKKVSLWNYEPKVKKKFFHIEIVIFSNMNMNFCTKNEKNPCRGFVGNFGDLSDLCSFQTLWCCTRSMKSDISTLLLIFLKRQKNKRFPSNSRWTK